MPTPILLVNKLPAASGVERDTVETTWAFILPTAPYSSTEAGNCANAVQAFFNGVHAPSTFPLSDYIARSISRVGFACTQEVYDLTDDGVPGFGAPKDTYTYGLAAPAIVAASAPSELAIAVSFHSNTAGVPEHGVGGTRPKARRRGRVYIGPFGVDVLTDSGVGNTPEPSSLIIEILKNAATAFMTQLVADGINWAVWSRVDKLLRSVTGGWVDNAWDVQRRRGEEPTSRSSFGAPSARSMEVLEVPATPLR
jgi:hypothetical protein